MRELYIAGHITAWETLCIMRPVIEVLIQRSSISILLLDEPFMQLEQTEDCKCTQRNMP